MFDRGDSIVGGEALVIQEEPGLVLIGFTGLEIPDTADGCVLLGFLVLMEVNSREFLDKAIFPLLLLIAAFDFLNFGEDLSSEFLD